jgi:hypothetical protein
MKRQKRKVGDIGEDLSLAPGHYFGTGTVPDSRDELCGYERDLESHRAC